MSAPKPDLVIPCLGKDSELAGPLSAIEGQRQHLGRVILVDDGSDPPLSPPSWVECHRNERPPDYRGAGFARNLGADLATSDWLLFMDHTVYLPHDALASMVRTAEELYRDELNLCITIPCIFLEGDPDPDLEVELQKQRKAGKVTALVEDLNTERVFREHTVAMMPRAYFQKLKGYDTDTFKHWGLEGTDFSVRVDATGGYLFSAVPRLSTGKRLVCYHAWHDGDRNVVLRQDEWLSKWGDISGGGAGRMNTLLRNRARANQ